MSHTLVVPLDGSAFAEQALPLALAISRRSNATLDLVRAHVLYALEDHAGGWAPFDPAEDAEFRRQEQGYLDGVARRVRGEHPVRVTCAVADGPAADAILGAGRCPGGYDPLGPRGRAVPVANVRRSWAGCAEHFLSPSWR
jgi:hypothetical protein